LRWALKGTTPLVRYHRRQKNNRKIRENTKKKNEETRPKPESNTTMERKLKKVGARNTKTTS
jgi:hypothetical protein